MDKQDFLLKKHKLTSSISEIEKEIKSLEKEYILSQIGDYKHYIGKTYKNNRNNVYLKIIAVDTNSPYALRAIAFTQDISLTRITTFDSEKYLATKIYIGTGNNPSNKKEFIDFNYAVVTSLLKRDYSEIPKEDFERAYWEKTKQILNLDTLLKEEVGIING